MQTVKIVLLCCVVAGCFLLYKLFQGKQPKKVLVWSSCSGIISLILVRLFGGYFVPTLFINMYTLGTASVLGVPGVILMMLTKLIWQL